MSHTITSQSVVDWVAQHLERQERLAQRFAQRECHPLANASLVSEVATQALETSLFGALLRDLGDRESAARVEDMATQSFTRLSDLAYECRRQAFPFMPPRLVQTPAHQPS